MFMGSTHGLPEFGSQNHILLPDNALESDDDDDDDEEVGNECRKIVYSACFDELAENYIQYDSIIWLSISLLLVLAWGVGVIMLLYLPVFRYVLRKDLSSRKLFVTPTEIVYKVSRPSFIPCWKTVTVERRIPLSLVIDIIIEQGCLQSAYGLHTFRVESISRGKAAPVDELQIQGVSNPGRLRKVIIAEAARVLREAWPAMTHTSSLSERKDWKVGNSAFPVPSERRGIACGDLLLQKIDEVNRSVKMVESLVDKSQFSSSDS
ncbi:hypothetical protein RND81_03G205800 [Saponaria officinalis]|uniref:DUF7642 domain-containing protein n=1 Tax=Saponaria officinalis TaxID=3572 RepID=A0AAW1M1T9_SAPOF